MAQIYDTVASDGQDDRIRPLLNYNLQIFFGSISGDVSQSGDGSKKDLAKFGYKPNMKIRKI
jgi:hypothetical protein